MDNSYSSDEEVNEALIILSQRAAELGYSFTVISFKKFLKRFSVVDSSSITELSAALNELEKDQRPKKVDHEKKKRQKSLWRKQSKNLITKRYNN